MNRCARWNICPLGDLAKAVGCRRPGCPERTAADLGSVLMTLSETPSNYPTSDNCDR